MNVLLIMKMSSESRVKIPSNVTNKPVAQSEKIDDQSSEYFSRKVTRYDSLGDLTEFSKKFINLEVGFKYFADLSINDSIIFYASTEANTNGIIFSQRTYDLNSNLFTRVFYHFVKSCFKIKRLFDVKTINFKVFYLRVYLQDFSNSSRSIIEGILKMK